MEGEPLDASLIALLEFPDAGAAEAFANDPEYAHMARLGKKEAKVAFK
jgi:uncharacterized protein (DUF1330 family)